jgi:predicted ArsR family transcriptional regulator
MTGLTINEIAEKLGITYLTAKQRLLRAGIKPLTKEAIYPNDVIDKIKNVEMGRPKKATEQEAKKPKASKPKTAKPKTGKK